MPSIILLLKVRALFSRNMLRRRIFLKFYYYVITSAKKWEHLFFSVCNLQSMKSPVELNSLLSKFFCLSPGSLHHLIRRDSGRLANEAFTSNPIISSKQSLNGLKITNCSVTTLSVPKWVIFILIWVRKLVLFYTCLLYMPTIPFYADQAI